MAVQIESSRAALLVCHLQGDIIENEDTFGGIFGPESQRREVVAHADRLLVGARSSGLLPVLVRIAFREDGSNLQANLPLLQMASDLHALIDGTAGTTFVAQVPPQPGDIVVTHHRLSPFSGTDLDTILRNRSVETLVLCGVATNIVVQATAFAAADLGYRLILAEDTCSAATPEWHEAAVETLRLLAEVSSVDEVLDAL